MNGEASYRKTIDELWRMWSKGERDGHALADSQHAEIDELLAQGMSQRAVARRLGIGRRAVRTHLEGRRGFRDARWRVRRMRVRVLNEATGEFTHGHIGDVIDKGVQPVYRLTLADGKELTVTENHRLLTTRGWEKMRDAVGLLGSGHSASTTSDCSLLTNGVPVHQDREWLARNRREGRSVGEMAAEAGCSYHTIRKLLAVHGLRYSREEQYRSRTPRNKGRRGYRTELVVSDRHREAIRRARSGPKSNFWRGGVTTERASIARWTREQAAKVHAQYGYTCQQCWSAGGKLHAHHIRPVWLEPARARQIGNLISVCEDCHRAIHLTREAELGFAERHGGRLGFARDIDPPTRRGWKLAAHPVRVVAVAYVGVRQTYDLTIEGDWHNFVANGIVVHNSFNEFSMRYAKATDEFYVPEPEDVRSQVGKPGAYSFEPVDAELAERTREELRAVYETAFATYERLVEAGVARELARSVMPVGAYTEFYWTINARALMNFVSLRAAETAQREIRRYADAVELFLADRMPITHDAFVKAGRTAP